VSIFPAIFWRQQIGWSYCASSRRFGLMSWRNTMEKVTLSAKRCPARGVMVRCYGYDANGLTLALSTFIFFSSLLFSRLRFGVTLGQGWQTCGPRSIQARPAVLKFVCCLFLLMNNFFVFNRFHSLTKKLCGPLTQR